jgi:amicoumacin kinase
LLVQSFDRGENTFYACVFEEAAGKQFKIRSVRDDVEMIRRWGCLLGTIHATGTKHHPAGGVRRYRWDEDDVWANADAYLPATEISARREWQAIREWLARYKENIANFGLLHGDLCVANFHVDSSRLTAFDFDDSCYHWFVYDIVCAIAPNIGRPKEDRRAIRRTFLEGYRAAMSLPDDWENAFDHFLRMRGLYLFVLNHRNWDGDMAAHPKRGFLDMLRASFEKPICW